MLTKIGVIYKSRSFQLFFYLSVCMFFRCSMNKTCDITNCDVPSNIIICLVCQLINLPLTCDYLVVVFGNQDLFVSPSRDFAGSHLV